MKKVIKNMITRKMQTFGYSPYFADIVYENRFSDFFKNKSISLKEKIWAQRRGFYSHRIKFYGLTEDNYKNYLPDFDYFKLHPINGRYNRWIDDKLTLRYMLHPFNEFLPEYYYHLRNDEVLPLMDCPEKYGTSTSDIINLLSNKQVLAGKLTAGSRGTGFSKFSFENNKYFINNGLSSESELCELFNQWLKTKGSGYLLTEYLKPHPDLSHIWPETPNTLRLMVIRNKNQSPLIINSFIRFGTQETGSVDNSGRGGIISHVSLDNGFFTDGKIILNNIISDMPHHPDTGIIVEGVVPHWKMICEQILNISSYFPEIIYFGYDIAITDTGFKILEINSHQSIGFIQKYNPFFTNELSKIFFNGLINEKQKHIEHQKNKRFFRRIIQFGKRKLTFLLRKS
jgi:hypothetical protein